MQSAKQDLLTMHYTPILNKFIPTKVLFVFSLIILIVFNVSST